MPVKSDQVPLDTAKSWAKRLAKHSKTINREPWTLAKSQGAIAVILGYAHWHALEEALADKKDNNHYKTAELAGTETVGDITKKTFSTHLSFLKIPHTPEDLREWWQMVCLNDEVEQIYITWRPETKIFTIKIGRCEKKPYHFDLKEHDFPHVLAALLPTKIATSLIENQLNEVVNFGFELAGLGENTGRYQFIPMYPSGWQFVVIPKASHKHRPTFEWLGLQEDVEQDIKRITQKPGSFFFTGTAGGGRTKTMEAVAHWLVKETSNKAGTRRHEQIIPGTDCETIILGRNYEWESLSQYRLNAVKTNVDTGGKDHIPRAMGKALDQNNASVVIIDDVWDQFTAEAMMLAQRQGYRVLASIHAIGDRLQDRVDDFFPANQAPPINGWCNTILLPLLCKGCRKPTGIHGEFEQGQGCERCQSFLPGIFKRQLFMSVWEMVDGKSVQLHDMKNEIIRLIQIGDLERKDGESRIGPGLYGN